MYVHARKQQRDQLWIQRAAMVTLSRSSLGRVSAHCPPSQSIYTHTNELHRHAHIKQLTAQNYIIILLFHAYYVKCI